MGDLINRQAAINMMWSVWNRDVNDSTKFSEEETQAVTRAFKRLQKAVEEMPTAFDVEEIIGEIDKISEPVRPVGWSRKIEVVETKAVIDIINNKDAFRKEKDCSQCTRRIFYQQGYADAERKMAKKQDNDFCEWKIDGVYLMCQHNTEIIVSCLEDEKYRYKHCPICGKKIKVVE